MLAVLVVLGACTGSEGTSLPATDTSTSTSAAPDVDVSITANPTVDDAAVASTSSAPDVTAVVTRPTPNPGPATDAGNWISISGLSETAIDVVWSEVEGDNVRYELHRAPWVDGFSGFTNPLGAETVIYEGTDLGHVDTTMSAGSEYVYAVVAVLANGERTEPRWRQGDAVNDTEPPSAVTGLTASLGARGITLTWDQSTDNYRFADYQIYRGEEGAEPTWIATSPTATQTMFLDDDIPSGVELTYWVFADDFHENRTEPAIINFLVN